jgi:hypothetical protein
MIRLVVALCVIRSALLMGGCSENPPSPVLPDGSHRVPVNVTLPVLPSDGDTHEP